MFVSEPYSLFFGLTLELGQTLTKILLALNEIHILVMMQGRRNL